MKDKTIVSTVTLAASLISYFYAKETTKDVVPYVMIGGFVGAVIGEIVVVAIKNKDNNK
jgi:uncharacterized membrane protein YfcA